MSLVGTTWPARSSINRFGADSQAQWRSSRARPTCVRAFVIARSALGSPRGLSHNRLPYDCRRSTLPVPALPLPLHSRVSATAGVPPQAPRGAATVADARASSPRPRIAPRCPSCSRSLDANARFSVRPSARCPRPPQLPRTSWRVAKKPKQARAPNRGPEDDSCEPRGFEHVRVELAECGC